MFNFNLFDPFMSQYQPIKYSHTSSCQLFEYRTKNPLVIFRCTHLLKIIGIKGQTLWRNVNFNFDASWNLSAFDTPISQTRRQTNHPTKRSSKLDLVKHELWLFLFGFCFFFLMRFPLINNKNSAEKFGSDGISVFLSCFCSITVSINFFRHFCDHSVNIISTQRRSHDMILSKRTETILWLRYQFWRPLHIISSQKAQPKYKIIIQLAHIYSFAPFLWRWPIRWVIFSRHFCFCLGLV